MAVQVQQEQLAPCRVALTIEVPPDEIQKAVSSVFNQFAKRTNVPGFRPGKAPRHLVARFIDQGRVNELALDQALNNAYRDALKQSGVAPYGQAEPDVELPEEEIDPEKGFSFKATIATRPQVELGSLEGLTGRRLVTPVADEDVVREIARYREAATTFEPTDEPAGDGDRVRGDLRITVEGIATEDVPEGPTLLEVGTNLEEFDAGLRGIKAGEEKSFEFDYPESNEELSGKRATATIQAVEVLRRSVPEESDEFAAKVGFENMEALRTRIRELLQNQADALADQEVNDSLITEVVRRATVHYPDEMLEHEISERMSDLIKAVERRGASLEQYLAAEEKDLATLQGEMRQEAQESLTNSLVLLELARQNHIGVAEKDVEEEVKRRAEAENVKTSQMRRLLNDTGEMDAVRQRIFFRKVVAFIREKAEITEVTA